MPKMTEEIIKNIMPLCPSKRRKEVLPHLNRVCIEKNITTELRLAAFLATLAWESGEFKYFEEIANGWNYDITKNPKKARELGNLTQGDGPKYKGRGPIQVTGKIQYQDFSDYLGIDFVAKPELLATLEYGFEAAAWYWETRNLNQYADKRQFRAIQSIVNRGHKDKPPKDWPQRLDYYQRSLRSLPDDFLLDPLEQGQRPDDELPDDSHPDFEPTSVTTTAQGGLSGAKNETAVTTNEAPKESPPPAEAGLKAKVVGAITGGSILTYISSDMVSKFMGLSTAGKILHILAIVAGVLLLGYLIYRASIAIIDRLGFWFVNVLKAIRFNPDVEATNEDD